MKINWWIALVISILLYIALRWMPAYTASLLPEGLRVITVVILFIAAKIAGNILETVFTRETSWMESGVFVKELQLFVMLGFFCWLFILGAERFIGGTVQLACIPPVAYYLVNWLYREAEADERELV